MVFKSPKALSEFLLNEVLDATHIIRRRSVLSQAQVAGFLMKGPDIGSSQRPQNYFEKDI